MTFNILIHIIVNFFLIWSIENNDFSNLILGTRGQESLFNKRFHRPLWIVSSSMETLFFLFQFLALFSVKNLKSYIIL